MNLNITKLRFRNNADLPNPIIVDLYIKPYYGGSFTLIQSNVDVRVDGTINESPVPLAVVDPTLKYILRAVDTQCGDEYDQVLSINAYCPLPYTLSEDASYCYIEEITDAIPPSSGVNTVAVNNGVYTSCGTRIVQPGFNLNGTGPSTLINVANPYWINGPGDCLSHTTTDGPLNRCGLWAASGSPSQVGFSVCVNIPTAKTYYVGVAADDYATIRLDGEDVVVMDQAALAAQYFDAGATFKNWFIYPVDISAGLHILEMIGSDNGVAASIGAQIYDNTPSEIAAATSDGDLNMIFNTADYVGMPVVLGTEGTGYSCPVGAALQTCESPFRCRKLVKIPISY